ncbi:MAG: hypothetical protein AAF378_18640 [Cyanobacteria bacterium P01_A01_bin.84]
MGKNLTIDYTKEYASLQILPTKPILSSYDAEWNSISLEYHQHYAHEAPEHYPEQHIIVVHHKNLIEVERQLDGHFHNEYVQKGDIVLSPANIPHKARWKRKAEFTLLIIEPCSAHCL